MAVRSDEPDAVPGRLRQDVAAVGRRPAVQRTEAERVGARSRYGECVHAMLEVRAQAGIRPANRVRDAVLHEVRFQRIAAIRKRAVAR